MRHNLHCLTSEKDYWDQFLIVKILQDTKKEMEQKKDQIQF